MFPYEVKETILSVSKMMKKENKTVDEIKEKLRELKIPDVFIQKFIKKN